MVKVFTAFILTILLLQTTNNATAQTWCTPAYYDGCDWGDYIESFSTTGGSTNITNNYTGCPSSILGYSNYSATHIHTGLQGATVNYSFTNNPSYDQGYKIWVDWNNNGSFADAGEEMYASSTYIFGGQTVTGSFVIPLTATPGTKRMRIRCAYYSTTFDACSLDDYGEAEDYGLVVMPLAGDGGVKALISPTGPVCANQQTVQVSIQNYGTNDISNFQVHWSINNIAQTPYTYTGTLQPSVVDIITLGSATFNAGSNTIKAWTGVTNDTDKTNDTLNAVRTAPVFTANTDIDTLCSGQDASLYLLPNSGYASGILQWQISDDGTNFTNIPNSSQPNWIEPNLNLDSWFRVFINSGNGGCYSDTVKVTINDIVPEVDLGNDTSICTGLSITLDAGNPGSEYLWNDNSTNKTLSVTTPGIYYVTVTNTAGCSITDSIELLMEKYPYGDFDMNPWPGIISGKYTFVAHVFNTTNYYWDFGDGSPTQTGSPINHQFPSTGEYTVTLHLENECATTAVITKKRTILVSTKELTNNTDVSIYPNPANNYITIENNGQLNIESLTIYDALGRIMKQIENVDSVNPTTISTESWSNGIYSVIIKTNGNSISKRITITKE